MGKMLIETFGTIQIKMDVKDDTYYDAKDPHVSFVRQGRDTVSHCYLSEVDNLVGTGDSDLQDAIRYVRKNKEDLRQMYLKNNR